MFGPQLIQPGQVFEHAVEQWALVFERKVLRKHLFEARYQPAKCGTAGTQLARIHNRPMMLTEVTQQSEACEQPGKGLALMQCPGQPDSSPQVLGLMA